MKGLKNESNVLTANLGKLFRTSAVNHLDGLLRFYEGRAEVRLPQRVNSSR